MMFLLAVCTVSSFVIIGSPRQTNAEGLLYTVTCNVTNVLLKVCRQAPTQSDPPAPSTPTPAQPSPETSPSPVMTETAPPLEETQPLAPVLPDVSPITGNLAASQNYRYPSSALMTIYGDQSNSQSVLGATSRDAVLEASPQGWRLFGLAWYWWVLMIGAVIGFVAVIKNTVTKSFASIVK